MMIVEQMLKNAQTPLLHIADVSSSYIMKIARPKTEKWHNYEEGDCGKPIDRDGSNKAYFKKGWWKRYDRKKFFRNINKWFE